VDSAAKLATDAAFGSILRDIARGGITGLIVGLVAAGIGGRIVMRLAALLVPESAGAFTENGNRIGEITLGGSLGLVLFGLIAGAAVATIWVVISPWIPGVGMRRAFVAMPIAVALGAFALIDGENRDFSILEHHPGVVGVLILLIAVIGLMFALVDDALDRRLPVATGRALAVYGLLTIVGLGLAMMVLVSFLSAPETVTVLTGVALIGVGVATLGTWVFRVRGQPAPARLVVVGRVALVAAVVVGSARLLPEVTRALGMA
jgi:hypothetical protein